MRIVSTALLMAGTALLHNTLLQLSQIQTKPDTQKC